jgi:carboxymethylenebutenolidase
VLAHYGGQDREAARLPTFEAAMAAHGKDFTTFVYPGVQHLFFDQEQDDYEPSAAALAWDRTWKFLHARLQGTGSHSGARGISRQKERRTQ